MKLFPPWMITYGRAALNAVRLHAVVLYVLVMGLVSTGLIIRINQLSQAEPTVFQLDESRSGVAPPKVDQTTISLLQDLENREVSIESVFDNGRTNPFED